jgi:hypothetical protein
VVDSSAMLAAGIAAGTWQRGSAVLCAASPVPRRSIGWALRQ